MTRALVMERGSGCHWDESWESWVRDWPSSAENIDQRWGTGSPSSAYQALPPAQLRPQCPCEQGKLSRNEKRHWSFLFLFHPCWDPSTISLHDVLRSTLISLLQFHLLLFPTYPLREEREENAPKMRRGMEGGLRDLASIEFLLCYRHRLAFSISDQFCFRFVLFLHRWSAFLIPVYV